MAKKVKRTGRPPGHDSLYGAVVEDLQQRLSQGEWKAGKPLPSTRQLASHYELSQRSIRRALAQLAADGRVVVQARRRVLCAPDSSLEQTLSGSIALVLNSGLFNSLNSVTFQSMFRGIAKEAQKLGASVVILQSDRWRTEFPAGLIKMPLKGVILFGVSFRPNVLKHYEDMKVPVVLLDRPGDEWNLNSITVDNYRAAHDAASRIIALGHRNIALIRYINRDMQMVDPDDRERIAGFRAACAPEREVHVKLFSVMNPHLDATIQEILNNRPRFTAVFTSYANYAERLAVAAEKMRISVPRALSILAFRSSDPQARDWSGPQIDFFDMAQQAVKLIARKPATPIHIRVPTTWNHGTTVSAPTLRGRSVSSR